MKFFFSSTDARCRAPFIRKNHVLQRDDDDAKVPGAKKQQAKNNSECAFLHVRGTSRAYAGPSRIVGTLRNCVSLGLRELMVMLSLSRAQVATKVVHDL